MKWIPTSTELPNWGVKVLGCDRRGGMSVFWIDLTQEGYETTIEDGCDPSHLISTDKPDLGAIVCWMPLPNPPNVVLS